MCFSYKKLQFNLAIVKSLGQPVNLLTSKKTYMSLKISEIYSKIIQFVNAAEEFQDI